MRDRLFAQNKKENLFYAFQVFSSSWIDLEDVTARACQGFMYILQQEKEERIRREQEEPELRTIKNVTKSGNMNKTWQTCSLSLETWTNHFKTWQIPLRHGHTSWSKFNPQPERLGSTVRQLCQEMRDSVEFALRNEAKSCVLKEFYLPAFFVLDFRSSKELPQSSSKSVETRCGSCSTKICGAMTP